VGLLCGSSLEEAVVLLGFTGGGKSSTAKFIVKDQTLTIELGDQVHNFNEKQVVIKKLLL